MNPCCRGRSTLTEAEIPDELAGLDQSRVSEIHAVDLCGEIDPAADLSGVVVIGDYLVLGADEGHCLQILRRTPDNPCWSLQQKMPLAKQDQETDIEAISFGDGHLYVIGSHSSRRRRIKPELSVHRNRERLLQVRQDPSRNRLYRIPFDPGTGTVGNAKSIDLSKRLRRDPLLKTFYAIPSKENGIDIEGMAYRDGLLYIGFRGPVLRHNLVPVMLVDFKRPKQYTVNFVCLDGQGVRDMAVLEQGFLILSGPVNDAPGPFQLWWWDGADQIPGRDRVVRPAVTLGPVSAPGGAKAEGLALLAEQRGTAQVLVVYDTETTAQAVSMRVDLPT